jgi:hypothetical protein
MGRPVRAFDNINRKLSRYFETWGDDLGHAQQVELVEES